MFIFDDSIPIVALGEISTIVKGHNLVKNDMIDNGVGCIHYGEIYTYYDTYAAKTISYVSPEMAKKLVVVHNGDLIITVTGENVRDICKCVAWLGEDDIVTGDHTAVIRHNQNPKYLSYWFQTIDFYKQKYKIAQGANVIDVPISKIKEIKIPLPPLPIQEYIVDILDNFTMLISDINAEINLRKQQYEYYMDKLLTFDNLQEPTIYCLKSQPPTT